MFKIYCSALRHIIFEIFADDDLGSNHLMKVNLSLVDHSACNSLYSSGTSDDSLKQGIVEEWQICAGEKGKDTCQVSTIKLIESF